MQMKKINAAELEAKYSDGKEKPIQLTTGSSDFPKYDEYETVVGKGVKKKGDPWISCNQLLIVVYQ